MWTGSQWASGGFDSGSFPKLGVARTGAADLAESLNVLKLDGQLVSGLARFVGSLDPTQVQHAVKQHRCMTTRKNETISIGPVWLGGIEFHRVVEKLVGNRGQSHGGSRVSAVGSLHRIHAEGADCVDC